MLKFPQVAGFTALFAGVFAAVPHAQASAYGHGILQSAPYVQGDVRPADASDVNTSATTANNAGNLPAQPAASGGANSSGSYGYRPQSRSQATSQASSNGTAINLDAAAAESSRASVYAPY